MRSTNLPRVRQLLQAFFHLSPKVPFHETHIVLPWLTWLGATSTASAFAAAATFPVLLQRARLLGSKQYCHWSDYPSLPQDDRSGEAVTNAIATEPGTTTPSMLLPVERRVAAPGTTNKWEKLGVAEMGSVLCKLE